MEVITPQKMKFIIKSIAVQYTTDYYIDTSIDTIDTSIDTDDIEEATRFSLKEARNLISCENTKWPDYNFEIIPIKKYK